MNFENIFERDFLLKISKFVIVGCVTTALYYLLVVIGVEILSLDPLLAICLSFAIYFVVSFILNRRWVFNANNLWGEALLKYTLMSVGGFIIQYLMAYVLIRILGFHYQIALLVNIVVMPIYTFVVNNFWTFSTADKA